MTSKPEQTLLNLINHFGWTSWEIGLGDSQEHELGNGLSVSGLNLEYAVRADSTETTGYRYDIDGADLGQFNNVSAQHTGQYSSPDCMHDGESLSAHMLSQYMQPGEYAIAFIDWDCAPGDDCGVDDDLDDHSLCELYPEGWLFLTNERDFFTVRAQWEGDLCEPLLLTESIDEAYSFMEDLNAKYADQSGVTVDVYDQNGSVLASESIS